jgi:hypothetical protein
MNLNRQNAANKTIKAKDLAEQLKKPGLSKTELSRRERY